MACAPPAFSATALCDSPTVIDRQLGAYRVLRELGRGGMGVVYAAEHTVIGRKAAVADLGGLRLSGFPAWALWAVAHVWFLIGWRNRMVVALSWLWSYWTFQRGARPITSSEEQIMASTGPSDPRERAVPAAAA